MNHDEERRRKLQEAAQHMLERGLLNHEALRHAMEQGLLTPEQAQMAQQALQQMQQSGAAHFTYTVIRQPDGTIVQQGSPPAGYPSGFPHGDPGMHAPPMNMLPNQPMPPSAVPQGYVDPLFENAIADLQRWLGQYEKYRMQGRFAQLEPIFQTIKQITAR